MNIYARNTIKILSVMASFLAAPAFAATQTHTCKPVEVAVFAERIHVRCNVPATVSTSTGIIFFSVPTANAAHADRMLSVLTSAHIAQKQISITFDPNDTSGTAFGCLANDCRRILSLGVN